MEKMSNQDKLKRKKKKEVEEMDDLDLFIEKRKIQNEALKKIVEMDQKPSTTKTKRRRSG